MGISYFLLMLIVVNQIDSFELAGKFEGDIIVLDPQEHKQDQKPKSSRNHHKPNDIISSYTLKHCEKLAEMLLPNGIEILDHFRLQPKTSEDIISSHILKHCKELAGMFLPNGIQLLGRVNVPRPKTQLYKIGGPVGTAMINGSKSISLTSQSNKCKPSNKCKKANGECISKDKTCDGTLIGNGCKPNKGCKKTHVCCAQTPSCSKPKGKCKKAGGKCISKNEDCSGKLISKGCNKKEGCKCCVEEEEEECKDKFSNCRNLFEWLGDNNSTGVCQKRSENCDGDQFLGQCEGSSDCVCCAKATCPPTYHKCNIYTESSGSYEYRCILPEQVCDGTVDCKLGDDEKSCTFCATDEFRCTLGECVPKNKRCDGINDCSNNNDELNCTWSYDGEAGTYGPDQWSILYPDCSSSRQSPISLSSDADDTNFDEITFHNYTKNISAHLFVTENQFMVEINPIVNKLTIQGGGLTSNKTLVGSLFHWGSDSSKGSDHTINNKRYPMEMQLIHIEEGIDINDDPSSTMLISVMFEISETDNQALDPIIQAASVMAQSGLPWGFGYAILENLQVNGLLPNNRQEFYRYEGSVPLPPCIENIPWTVFTHTSTVSEKQLNVLRSLKIGKKSIANNFRPLQPINDRQIFLNE